MEPTSSFEESKRTEHEHSKDVDLEDEKQDLVAAGEGPNLMRMKTKLYKTIPKYEGPNPFETATPLSNSLYEKIKVIVMTITLIPFVRLLLCVICLLFVWVFCKMATCCHDRKKPYNKCRRILIAPARFSFRIMLFISGFYWITTSDKRPKGAQKPNIIVVNHTGLFDAFWIQYKTGCASVAKKELWNLPLVRTVLDGMQCIPVDRLTSEGRKKAIRDITERTQDKRFPPLCIFPEGTVSNNEVLTTFKRGPFIPGQPVQPLILNYSYRHCDLFLGHGMFWQGYRSLCQLINFVHYEWLPPYEPSPEEIADPLLFAYNVRDVMATAKGVTVTQHSYDDVRLRSVVHKKYHNIEVEEFVTHDIHSEFGFKFHDVQKLLERFSEFDESDTGYISYEEFCIHMKVPVNSSLGDRLFRLFDSDNTGQIGFSDFMAAMSVVSTHGSFPDNLRILFEIVDRQGNGMVTRGEFDYIIHNVKKTKPKPTEIEQKTGDVAIERRSKRQPSIVTTFNSARFGLDFDLSKLLDTHLFTGGREEKLDFQIFCERLNENETEVKAVVKLLLWRTIGGFN